MMHRRTRILTFLEEETGRLISKVGPIFNNHVWKNNHISWKYEAIKIDQMKHINFITQTFFILYVDVSGRPTAVVRNVLARHNTPIITQL